jgi:hypothetical protein
MDETSLILSGLLPSIFAKRRMSGEQRWALVLEADQDPEGSVWTQASYFCKGDLGFGFGSFHPGFVRESNATRLASQLARLAGINWLLQGSE